ncbi:hypothetical protein CcaCcLH18_10254 [Colletotrichum camelliae]|nr:hypothetical protein CcaCcLH18_10254 [Colletotrichum camelliae]
MAATQYATYHLAPNFSMSPPPDGPLHLGSIIDDLRNPEPVNEGAINPPEKVYNDTKMGFTASRSKMKGGQFGIWAKAVGIDGLGVEASANYTTTSEVTYRFESIDTEYFHANDDYITSAMNKEDVKEFMQGNRNDPVYIVTGLKIARRPTVRVRSEKKKGAKVGASINQPWGLPIDTGVGGTTTNEDTEEMEFEASGDFVIGIRVKKVRYTLWGRICGKPSLSIKKHDRGATLVGDNNETLDNVLEVEEVNDEGESGLSKILESDNATGGVIWVLEDTRIML